MKLIKRNPELSTFDHLFDRFFNDEPINWMNQINRGLNGSPAVNIEENDQGFELSLIAPGFKKENFKIEMDQDVLSISAEWKDERKEKEGNFYRREFSQRSFERRFQLPEGKIAEDEIKARYEDGILKIELPKRPEHKPAPARLIDIK